MKAAGVDLSFDGANGNGRVRLLPGPEGDGGPGYFRVQGVWGAGPGLAASARAHSAAPGGRYWHQNGNGQPSAEGETRVDLGQGIRREEVSRQTLQVLREHLRKAGARKAVIIGVGRSARLQAEAFWENLQEQGPPRQRQIYGPMAEPVFEIYQSGRASGQTQDQILFQMEACIKAADPARFSSAAATADNLGFVSVTLDAAAAADKFRAALEADLRVIRWKELPPGRVYHVEVLQRRRPLWLEQPASPPKPTVPTRKVGPKTWVRFEFVYPDQQPVTDLAYVLEDPDGIQERGTLPKNGMVERRNVVEGTYAVLLKQIEEVTWEPGNAKCDETVRVVAKTAGFGYGTPAKVNIYREYRESEAEVIKALQGKVQDDRIEVEWKYDYAATPERKAEVGVTRFVAEVQLEGGKHWAKTRKPLELALKSIDRVTWSTARVEPEGCVELRIEAKGYEDETEVKLELWRSQWGTSAKVADFKPAKLDGGKATVKCAYGGGGGTGDNISEPGEYFVAARIDQPVERTSRSGLLWCPLGNGQPAGPAPGSKS